MKPGTMKTRARRPKALVKALAALSPINLSKPALRGLRGGYEDRINPTMKRSLPTIVLLPMISRLLKIEGYFTGNYREPGLHVLIHRGS